MARKKGGKGPGSLSMGGMGKKPGMASTPMASAPIGPPGGLGGPGPAGPTPGPLGVKKGGTVKHARGGGVEESAKHERTESKATERKETKSTGYAMGGDVKARVRGGASNC